MKKILVIIFLIIILIFYITDDKKQNYTEEVRGVYISYIDYGDLFKNKTTDEIKTNINNMLNNISEYGLNTIILQVRAFADAIYPSKIFPLSKYVSDDKNTNFDILKYFVEKSHNLNIKIHAWVNPYRISSNNIIDEESIYSAWKDTNNIEVDENGTYFNPAESDVSNLILDGIREIVLNYNIDGILYDDYFYPNKTIDLNSYAIYKANTNNQISIEEYRLNNITNLIKNTYQAIKEIKKDVLFGIAPAGNIENNLNEEYLDILNILKKDGYLDYVSPQLYYGFNNSNKPFIETLNIWNDSIKNDTYLLPSLALYKSGQLDEYAGDGKEEWVYNTDLIKKQILSSRVMSHYKGFLLYRYDFLFNNEKMNDNKEKEKENIKTIIK